LKGSQCPSKQTPKTTTNEHNGSKNTKLIEVGEFQISISKATFRIQFALFQMVKQFEF